MITVLQLNIQIAITPLLHTILIEQQILENDKQITCVENKKLYIIKLAERRSNLRSPRVQSLLQQKCNKLKNKVKMKMQNVHMYKLPQGWIISINPAFQDIKERICYIISIHISSSVIQNLVNPLDMVNYSCIMTLRHWFQCK